eukprot:COSAG05_NODE_2208_length_3395_cov_3.434466_2_plen_171_part_00
MGDTFHAPHALQLCADYSAVFSASGNPKHGRSAVKATGSWAATDQGTLVRVKISTLELKDSEDTTNQTQTFTLSPDKAGYGMNVNGNCVVQSFTEAGTVAERAGVCIGSAIVAVNGIGVSNKEGLLQELAAALPPAARTTNPFPAESEEGAQTGGSAVFTSTMRVELIGR